MTVDARSFTAPKYISFKNEYTDVKKGISLPRMFKCVYSPICLGNTYLLSFVYLPDTVLAAEGAAVNTQRQTSRH